MANVIFETPSAWAVLEDTKLPEGYRVEITDQKIIMTPRSEYQGNVILDAAPQIKRQLDSDGRILSDVMIDFPSSGYGYAPDLAIVTPGAERNARGRFEWHSLEAVIEVVSRSTRDYDFEKKFHLYAQCGIPVYVIVDPETGTCTVHGTPQRNGTYERAEEVPFGDEVVVPMSGGRKVVIATGGFPRAGDLE